MKKYLILTPATFPAGAVLGLSAEQAASRKHALKALDKGVFEATAPVQFKAGEEVGYAGDLPKVYGQQMEDVAKVKTKAKPSAAAAPAADNADPARAE